MRILIPLLKNEKKESHLSMHFGHAPYFGVFDSDKDIFEIYENKLDHSDINHTPVDQLGKFDIDYVFALEIGKRAINLFRKKGITVKTGIYSTAEEVIKNLDSLEDIKGGCNE